MYYSTQAQWAIYPFYSLDHLFITRAYGTVARFTQSDEDKGQVALSGLGGALGRFISNAKQKQDDEFDELDRPPHPPRSPPRVRSSPRGSTHKESDNLTGIAVGNDGAMLRCPPVDGPQLSTTCTAL